MRLLAQASGFKALPVGIAVIGAVLLWTNNRAGDEIWQEEARRLGTARVAQFAADKAQELSRGYVEPWIGVEVQVLPNASEVRRAVQDRPGAGWSDGLAAYCGQRGKVVRYDSVDRRDGLVRVQHYDGRFVTWALAVVRVGGYSMSDRLQLHPSGVHRGDRVIIVSTPDQAEAMASALPDAPFISSMAQYCGHKAIVRRFDEVDKRRQTVRLSHSDGAQHTWPLQATM
eukprot:gene7694-11811_t